MATRTRHVFKDASEVSHLWAHQLQDHAKTAGRGNYYFQGNTIYSYGSHFPIAKIVSKPRKGKAVLFTYREYSSTTATHIGITRRAIPDDMKIIYCEKPTDGEDPKIHKQNWKYFLDKIQQAGESLKTRKLQKTRDRDLQDINKWVKRANDYSTWYGLKWKIEGDAVEEARKQTGRLDAMTKREDDKQQKKIIKKLGEQIEAWKAGSLDYIENIYLLKQTYLRVAGDNIETSQGARFPVAHGLKALPLIKKCHDEKTTWETNGKTIHLGKYHLDKIDEDGMVHAGCHHVGFSEVERVVKIIFGKENQCQTQTA